MSFIWRSYSSDIVLLSRRVFIVLVIEIVEVIVVVVLVGVLVVAPLFSCGSHGSSFATSMETTRPFHALGKLRLGTLHKYGARM